MEEKKYEAGKVEISSAEYRDLVTEAVTAQKEASEIRSERWKLEDEKRKLENELVSANKKIAELESILGTFQIGLQSPITSTPDPTATTGKPWWSTSTVLLNNKEGN